MSFILKLICNVAVLLVTYLASLSVFNYIELNYFTTWTPGDAWIATLAITIAVGLVISSIFFAVVEKVIPS